MLLGKRQRPPINRTTSLSEIKFDLNLPGESDVSSNEHSPSQNPVAGPYGSNGQVVAAAVGQQRETLDQRFLAMVTPPRGNMRRHSGDFSDAGHFLRSCSLCERLLVPGRDIYMYRGDTAFCSSECRQEQMVQDERKEKGKPANQSAVAATARPGKGRGAAADM